MFKTNTKRVHVASIGNNNAFESVTSSPNERQSHSKDDVTSPGEGMTSGGLINALKPLFFSMMCAGIFDYRPILKDTTKQTVIGKCLKAYRLTIICLFVANFLRYCMAYSAFSEFGAELLTSVLMHAWFLHCTVNVIVCYTIVEHPNKLARFFTMWDKYWKRVNDRWGSHTGEMEKASICKTVRKVTIRLTILAWIFAMGNVAFTSYIYLETNVFPHIVTPLSTAHPQAHTAKVVFLAVQFYLSVVWVLTVLAMFLIQLSLYYGVKQFATKIDVEITTKPFRELQGNMELFREQYTDLCTIIDAVDDIFQFNVGISLFEHVFTSLVLVYNLLWYETVRNSPAELITHFFWLCGTVVMLIMLMSACCLVNNWAHAPVKSLYKLSLKETTAEFSLQINMFLHSLNGSPIGLSALSLFVIDKQVVASVGGMLATYFVVLLQFQQSTATITDGVHGSNSTV